MKCKICGKPIKQTESMSYTDKERGLKMAPAHEKCIGAHMEKYFGKSAISDHLKGK